MTNNNSSPNIIVLDDECEWEDMPSQNLQQETSPPLTPSSETQNQGRGKAPASLRDHFYDIWVNKKSRKVFRDKPENESDYNKKACCKCCDDSIPNKPNPNMVVHLFNCAEFRKDTRAFTDFISQNFSFEMNKKRNGVEFYVTLEHEKMKVDKRKASTTGTRGVKFQRTADQPTISASRGNYKKAQIKKELDARLIILAANTGMSFLQLQSQEFRSFIYWLCGIFPTLSRNNAPIILKELAYEVKKSCLVKVNNSEFITVVIDGWTSRNGVHIYAINLVTEIGEELFYTSFEVPHDKQDAQYLKDQLAERLDEVNRSTRTIVQNKDGTKQYRTKLVAICTDGASVMTAMKKKLVQHCVVDEDANGGQPIQIKPYKTMIELKCFTHGLNNGFKLLFKNFQEVKDVFDKVKKVVNAFSGLSKVTQELLALGGKKMVVESKTRFATRYYVIKRVLENKDSLTKLVNDSVHGRELPKEVFSILTEGSVEFWGSVSALKEFLEPLAELVKKSETPYYRLSDSIADFVSISKKMLHLYQQNPQLCLRYGESFYDTIKQIFQRYINNEIAVLALIFDVLLRFKPSEEAKSMAMEAMKKFARRATGFDAFDDDDDPADATSNFPFFLSNNSEREKERNKRRLA
ncbi:unnamed protein product [Ambrosiozyma monospora]|uniref:Unnamed protein product n=1 Tax=Ambrosiozyma monospora TaxID=43982 RepID=A0A9W7DEY0_AMBMO|nr:unnamed protein product [Ambrosiozyma monospora]